MKYNQMPKEAFPLEIASVGLYLLLAMPGIALFPH